MLMMRRLNSETSDDGNSKPPYLDVVAVGAIQFLLALLVVCYGVFLMQFVEKDSYTVESGLWGAVLLIATSKITNPWVKAHCKHLSIIKRKVHKRNVIAAVITFCSGLTLLFFINTFTTLIILYGIFGGVLTSITSTYMEFATAEAFKEYPHLFSLLGQLTKSSTLVVTPHLILFFTNCYGTKQSFLIVAGILLHIIPFCCLVRTKGVQKIRLCKFQTLDRLSVEMADLSVKQPIVEEPSSSDEDEDEESADVPKIEPDEVAEEPSKPAPVSAASLQKYYETIGVNILPNIPEESDTDVEDDDINEISSKKLNRISAILLEMQENDRRNSNLSVINFFQPEEVVETQPEDREVFSPVVQKKSRCFSVSSSTALNLKMKKQRLKKFSYRNLARCAKALRTPHFYPALISSTVTTTLSTVVLATAPIMFVNSTRNQTSNNTPEEAAFLLTIIGFTWLFFLTGYPVFNNLSPLKTRILFLAGLSTLGLSLFIVHQFYYNHFVFFSMTFGIGHAIITYAEGGVSEDFFGKVKWKLLQGALEIFTGLTVILIYLVIYLTSVKIEVVLSYAYWLYVFEVVLWVGTYGAKTIVVYLKNTGRYKLEQLREVDL